MKRTLTAAALAAALGLSGPALAGGSLSFHFAPGNAQDAQALATGLVLYSIAKDYKNKGRVTQRGRDNLASLVQSGRGNYGVVHQEGRGHDASLTQGGYGNAYGIFQFGQGASAHVEQYGYGQAGVTIQYGW